MQTPEWISHHRERKNFGLDTMVQIIHPKAKWSRSDYWKLDHGPSRSKQALLSLLTPRYRAYKSTDLVRLRDLYFRCQRGLLSYEGLTASELKIFITQRALSPGVDKRPTVSNFKRMLELVDDDAIFDRFLDLPPELRLQIYTHYFDSLNNSSKPICGGQPPITFACRLTRQEALSLFYCTCRFTLPTEAPLKPGRFLLRHNALDFLNNTLTDNFARIRFIAMSCDAVVAKFRHSITIAINISDDECSAKISSFNTKGQEPRKRDTKTIIDDVNSLLDVEPHALVRAIAVRKGPLKLQMDDLHELLISLCHVMLEGVEAHPKGSLTASI
jgi:hypothetical protein